MQTFRLKKDALKQIRKKALLRFVPFVLVIVAFSIAIVTATSQQHADDEINVLPVYIPLVLVLLGFTFYRAINRQKKIVESYSLTISIDRITRQQVNLPELSIYYNEVRQVIKLRDGAFWIKGTEPGDVIVVPTHIEHYEVLEELLQRIVPISSSQSLPFLERYPYVSGLLVVALMACVYLSNNKLLVAAGGLGTVIFLTWSFLKVRSSKNIDARTKRNMWVTAIVLFSVIASMVMKLMA